MAGLDGQTGSKLFNPHLADCVGWVIGSTGLAGIAYFKGLAAAWHFIRMGRKGIQEHVLKQLSLCIHLWEYDDK